MVAGDYVKEKMSRAVVSKEEEEQGYALACKVCPRSDMKIEVVGKMARAIETRMSISFRFEMEVIWGSKRFDKEN